LEGGIAFGPRLRRAHGLASVAMRTGYSGHVPRIGLVVRIERGLADKTLRGVRFAQRGVHAHPLVENKTFAVVVRAAAFLEIFQNAAVELEDAAEPFTFHEGPGFSAADAARAEHHDGLFLQV